MDIDAVFLPLSIELIERVFPTDVIFHRHGASTYDPETGTVTGTDTDIAIKAGVLNRKRVEEGGPSEQYELALWVQHSASGLPFLPTTEDSLTYDSVLWRVTAVDPTYSSAGLIASKITARGA